MYLYPYLHRYPTLILSLILSFILHLTLSSFLRHFRVCGLHYYVSAFFFLLAPEGSGVFNNVYINRFLVFDTQLSIRIPGTYHTYTTTLQI
jgi:hypothetical protein